MPSYSVIAAIVVATRVAPTACTDQNLDCNSSVADVDLHDGPFGLAGGSGGECCSQKTNLEKTCFSYDRLLGPSFPSPL